MSQGPKLRSLLWALTGLPGSVIAQEPPPLEAEPAKIVGEIRDQARKNPVAGAEVFVDGASMARTDSEGRFEFYLGPGNRILEVRRIGYALAVARVILEAGARVDVVIELPERALQMDTIVIRGTRSPFAGRLAGFYQRRDNLGVGQFFSPEDLSHITLSRLSDLFYRARGVDVECLDYSCQTQGLRVTSGRATATGQTCMMEYFIDGIRWNPGAAGINVLNPEAVAAVEVYIAPHQVPAQFGGTRARCGVVVFWTKAGDF